MTDSIESRRGRFRVTREVITAGDAGTLAVIFTNVFPIAIEWDCNGVATYTAVSKWFDEIDQGDTAPLYEFVLTTRLRGNTIVEAVRK